MYKMSAEIKLEIQPGSLVGLKEKHNDPEVQERLRRWIRVYGPGPFTVSGQFTPDHVTLSDESGKVIYFGSSSNPSLHVGYVEVWEHS